MPNQAAGDERRRAYLLVAHDLPSRSVWLMRIQQAAETGGPGPGVGVGGANTMASRVGAARHVYDVPDAELATERAACRCAADPVGCAASGAGSVDHSSYDVPCVAPSAPGHDPQRPRGGYNEPFDPTIAGNVSNAGTIQAALPPSSASARGYSAQQQERIELDAIAGMRRVQETFKASEATPASAGRLVVTIQRNSLNGSFGFALAEAQYGGDIVVSRVMSGGLAVGKLQPGDRVLSANGSKIDRMDHYQVQGLVTGGMTAVLEIERGAKAPFEAGAPKGQRELLEAARERMRIAQAAFDASPRARHFASIPNSSKIEASISVTIAPVSPPRPARPQADKELEAMAKMKHAQADFEACRSAAEFGSDSFGEVETPIATIVAPALVSPPVTRRRRRRRRHH